MSGLRQVRRAAYASLGVAFALIVGCYDDDDYGYGFGGSSGVSSSGFFDSGVPARASLCDEIQKNESCSKGQGSCERGSSASYACNAHLRCEQQSWQYEAAERADCRTDCPTAYTQTFDGCEGPNAGSLLCEYDQGTCGCAPVYEPVDAGADAGVDDDAGDPEDAGEIPDAEPRPDAGRPRASRYEWRCVKPKASDEDEEAGRLCPRLRPREGEECVRPMTCDYGACVFEDGYRMGCYAGSWGRDISRSTQCDR